MKRHPLNQSPSPAYDRQAWWLAVLLSNLITIGTLVFLGFCLVKAFDSPEPFDLVDAFTFGLFFVTLFLSAFDVFPSLLRGLLYRLILRRKAPPESES